MLHALLPFAVVVPLLAAAALMPLSHVLPRWAADTVGTACALFVTVLCSFVAAATRTAPMTYWFGGWLPHNGVALGIAFHADPLGAGIAAFAGLLTTLAFAFSWKYFDSAGTLFHTLMLVFLAAMAGFALTGDIFNLFVFFELMSIAAFALCGYKIEEEASIQGAINFAISNGIGAFLVLIGIALLYGRTGALNMAQIGAAVARGPADGLLVVACTLIVTGFFVKGAVVPFHFWLDDAHAVAPTPLCVLFSGVMVQLSLYAVARIYWTIFAAPFHGHDAAFRGLLIGAGIVSALLGAIMAFMQGHIKRMLAFSTISHSGMFVCGIGLLTSAGIAAVAVFVVAHGLVKAALFMGAGIVLQRKGSVNETELRGRCRDMLPSALLFLIGGLALAGMPPFGLAAGKAMLDDAAAHAHVAWLGVIFGAASSLDGGAVLRVAGSIFLGWGSRGDDDGAPKQEVREADATRDKTPLPMIATAFVALALCLAAGVLAHQWRPEALAENLGVAGLAVLLALFGASTNLDSVLRLLSALRAMHDGIFTDYVLWLLAGVAVYGAIMLPIAIR